jgi:hypothetical protein
MRSKPKRQRNALTWLRLKYRLATALEAPFGDVFWLFHQWAVRLQDELANREAIQ